MQKTDAQKGFEVMAALLKGQHKYSQFIEEYEEPLCVRNLEISDTALDYTLFVGIEGHTASIGAFIDYIVKYIANSRWEQFPCIGALRKIYMDTETEGQHMIFFAVVFNDNVEVIVGGCTDFSGEGGQGNQDLTNFFYFLSELYDVQIRDRYYTQEQYEATVETIQKAQEQRDMEHEW